MAMRRSTSCICSFLTHGSRRMTSQAAQQEPAAAKSMIFTFMSDAHPVVKAAGLALGTAVTAGAGYSIYNSVVGTAPTPAHAQQSLPSSPSSSSAAPSTSGQQVEQPWWSSPCVHHGLLAFAGVAGMSGVGLGAIGFHGLRKILARQGVAADKVGQLQEFWRVAVSYQLWHAGALLATAPLPTECAVPAGACFAAGTALFSGSIYTFVLTRAPAFQLLTPFGGIAFMAGWGVVALHMGLLAAVGPKDTDSTTGRTTATHLP